MGRNRLWARAELLDRQLGPPPLVGHVVGQFKSLPGEPTLTSTAFYGEGQAWKYPDAGTFDRRYGKHPNGALIRRAVDAVSSRGIAMMDFLAEETGTIDALADELDFDPRFVAVSSRKALDGPARRVDRLLCEGKRAEAEALVAAIEREAEEIFEKGEALRRPKPYGQEQAG